MRILLFTFLIYLLASCDYDGSSGAGAGKSGSMARFAISGNQLYTVSDTELTVFDISTASKPRKVSSQYLRGFAETIFVKDSLLFFGTRGGMLIYDTKDVLNPEYISEYTHIYSCDPVVVNKNIAFVTLNSSSVNCGRGLNQLEIVDLSNIYNPVSLAQYDMASPKGLGIDGDILFVCDNGLKAYHVDDLNNIDLIEQFDVDAYDVIPDNGYLFLIGDDGFHQYKYTDRGVVKVSSILTE